jgi:hypothetical protein
MLTTAGYPDERIQALNSDHRNICKFESPKDTNYRTLRNRLASTVDEIERSGEHRSMPCCAARSDPVVQPQNLGMRHVEKICKLFRDT